MYRVLYSFLVFYLLLYQLNGQILRFGAKLDGTGNLVMVDTIFRLENIPHTLYAKIFSKTPLQEDTFFIVIKNLHGSHKFVMKRSVSKMDALATLRIKEDGIYKVFVISPKTKQTLASKKLYITSAVNPNVQALKADYQKQLTAQNQSKSNPNVQKNQNTVNVKPNIITNTNTTKSNPTGQDSNGKPSTAKDDFDDIEDDDIDTEDIETGADIDAELDKSDDLLDFDDAD